MWRMMDRMEAIVATSPAYAATSPFLTDRGEGSGPGHPVGIEDLAQKHPQPAPAPDAAPYFLFVGSCAITRACRR